MLPLEKSLVTYLKLTLTTASLLFTRSVTAEVKPENTLSASNLNKLGKIKLTPSKNYRIYRIIAAESSDSGIPSLRRQPTGGERFEPKRIPFQIPFPKKPSYRTSPSITIINPSAYGASWGSAGIGVGYQQRARFREQSDGVIGLGFGLGNPLKNVGVQIGISLVDVSAPFRDGGINLKLHRRLPQDFSVALGVQGAVKWGETDGGSSIFGVATKRFKLRQDRTKAFSEMYTTLGIGGGQFRSESDINNGNDNIGIFGSLAVKVIQPVGFVAEWSGQDLTIGVPLVLFRRLPIVIVPAITDITGSAGDGTRFIVGLGYSFSF
ncbi:MAG: hypothetical protein AAFO95_21355 [Cyanobacteria bacterium J06600_6]